MANKSNMDMVLDVMALGNIFTSDIKERNNWKLRMLKTQNIDMPDDWDILPEEEKEARLNNIIAMKGK